MTHGVKQTRPEVDKGSRKIQGVFGLSVLFSFHKYYTFPPLFLCLVMHSAQKQNGLPLIALTPLAWLTSWPHATSSAHPHSSHIMLCWDATESAVSVVTHLLRKKWKKKKYIYCKYTRSQITDIGAETPEIWTVVEVVSTTRLYDNRKKNNFARDLI